jgi:hypothetical protein
MEINFLYQFELQRQRTIPEQTKRPSLKQEKSDGAKNEDRERLGHAKIIILRSIREGYDLHYITDQWCRQSNVRRALK